MFPKSWHAFFLLFMGHIRERGHAQKSGRSRRQGEVYISAEEVLDLIHDIKNLLLPIQVAAGLLREQAPNNKEEKHLSTILEQTDCIKRLIDDVLLSKDGLGWNTAIDATELVAQVARRVSADLKVGISCSYPRIEPVMVRGTEPKLWRILHNLVLNAAEAAGKNGNVDVRLSLEQAAGMAVVEVEDSGPGIPAQVQVRLFDNPFTTKAQGMGLGLTAVRNLVLQLGGDVSFLSEPGRGTTFLVRLPLA
ncbi:HAMP domain-containing histidine kinase [Acidobacteriia bacterium AH_259_A11_L15]|nr:HAMP domain-containing histidine kinase [Acidobacteriia bacterium AH_259_A11_L15]